MKRKLRRILCDWPPVKPSEEGLGRTAALCGELARQEACRPRTGFWVFLWDTARFCAARLWGMQALALLVMFAATASLQWAGHIRPAGMAALAPLLVAACVPELYRSQRYGMAEVECATRASTLHLLLAKLILASAADLVLLAVLLAGLWPMAVRQGLILIQLGLYVAVPFLGAAALCLWCLRRHTAWGAGACMALCASVSAAGYWLALFAPAVYGVSGLGMWAFALVVCGLGLVRQLYRLVVWAKAAEYGTA